MPGTDHRCALQWCLGCNAETRHVEGRAAEGPARRTYICVECGMATRTVVELSEVEYDRLRRAEAELQVARTTMQRLLDALLSGEDLPAPLRRTEPWKARR